MAWIRRGRGDKATQQMTFTIDMPISEDQVAELYGEGARIHSVHHRSKPEQSVFASTMSSNASVDTTVGSTAALIHSHAAKVKKKKYAFLRQGNSGGAQQSASASGNNGYLTGRHCRDAAIHSQKELNIRLATPTVPNFIDQILKKKQATEQVSAKRLSSDDDDDDCDDDRDDDEDDVFLQDLKSAAKIRTPQNTYVPQILASLTVSLCSMVVGFASAYTSPALPSMNRPGSPLSVTEEEGSWIGSLMPLAALIGGMAGGPLIESIGRKTTILATGIPFIISFILIAMAVNVQMVMAGRAIAGFCVGVASLGLPVYLGETVQPQVRGTLGLLPTTLGNSGILLCFIAGKYLNWQMLAILGACIPIPFLVCMFLIPETPQWYISRNKSKKAKKALQWLRGKDADVTQEFSEIEKANHMGKNEEMPGYLSLFSKMYSKPLLISMGLMLFQQLSGINAVIFYTVKIFKEAGSTIDENLCTIIVGIVNFLSTFIATGLIDKLGRKILLYASSATMAVTLITLGTFFNYKNNGYDVSQYGWLPLASFVFFIIGFAIGFGPIPWLMMGEILPAKIRGTAASLATAFNWACTFVVTKTFADLLRVFGTDGTFWMFGGICLMGLVFIVFCVPETQGKSLEDIERNLTGVGKGPVRQVRRMSSIAHLKPLPMAI
ncbi:facilitated trehalose transporter Tret1-like isoform X1 [Metopolophium dirhodum]|uniref:facilitated trehalose transporter Tret1-like isoform X1 n=2 Tax=Metopolophium dirhodum TaxID=44670 RepID=UPI0029907E01|nr:facilitated trehalose transporter Tret1-like isoform X1 [Metopolophium dirhodum]XP_060868901.1 facilitated trehalose transporter Tret1-like isoform X1 [Metopolophium dirhodum]XP_060868903.1 facilitated trehalose transporter Tret1-like isoform X1 [Metopolophium dirhodum]XP_060868904.1 facilitated trehalose transporter Tret1-like isoform X1 [Metopolophium dirhodum]